MKRAGAAVGLGILVAACSASSTGARGSNVNKNEPDAALVDAAVEDGAVMELDAAVDGGDLDADLVEPTTPDGSQTLVLPMEDASEPDASATPSTLDAELDAAADAEIDAGDSYESRVLAKLRSCSVLGTGEHKPHRVSDDRQRCLAECYLEASCADLKSYFCQEETLELEDCIFPCLGLEIVQSFTCTSGTQVWADFACDGLKHCADGSDEQGCSTTFQCASADGGVVADNAHCDGFPNCADKSDELGCASTCDLGAD